MNIEPRLNSSQTPGLSRYSRFSIRYRAQETSNISRTQFIPTIVIRAFLSRLKSGSEFRRELSKSLERYYRVICMLSVWDRSSLCALQNTVTWHWLDARASRPLNAPDSDVRGEAKLIAGFSSAVSRSFQSILAAAPVLVSLIPSSSIGFSRHRVSYLDASRLAVNEVSRWNDIPPSRPCIRVIFVRWTSPRGDGWMNSVQMNRSSEMEHRAARNGRARVRSLTSREAL